MHRQSARGSKKRGRVRVPDNLGAIKRECRMGVHAYTRC